MIRNIVFDVGWVFVHLNAKPLLDFLVAHEAAPRDLEALATDIVLADHETGRLPGHGLLERMAELAKQPVALDSLHRQWVDMFELQPAMVDLAHRLSGRYRVYLLSNVGDLHWAHLSSEYRLHRIGHGVLPSYVAGFMKPHEGIYREAERRFGLEPAQTVFIDDRADNIDAARARGWHGIVHKDHAATVTALRTLDVRC
ncbi:MAG TPA: HAD family phosphatase [Steroidobacteraceae bacterium]|nr:HAD family phosphatase [Steroidobacteraceae bacterium]